MVYTVSLEEERLWKTQRKLYIIVVTLDLYLLHPPTSFVSYFSIWKNYKIGFDEKWKVRTPHSPVASPLALISETGPDRYIF